MHLAITNRRVYQAIAQEWADVTPYGAKAGKGPGRLAGRAPRGIFFLEFHDMTTTTSLRAPVSTTRAGRRWALCPSCWCVTPSELAVMRERGLL